MNALPFLQRATQWLYPDTTGRRCKQKNQSNEDFQPEPLPEREPAKVIFNDGKKHASPFSN